MSDESSHLLHQHGAQGSQTGPAVKSRIQRSREFSQNVLGSHKKHYVIIGLVTVDVLGIFTDIFINLITCDMGVGDEPWVAPTRRALTLMSLVISSIFMVELLASLWAFGFGYFSSWFTRVDAAVIIASFLIDTLTQGIAEEIGSLVVILRLWRFIKIVEEFSLGASEQMEFLQARLELLEKENGELKDEIRAYRPRDEEAGDG